MNRKLVVFDIDGTIISYQNENCIPKETIAAIQQLKSNGNLIAAATGRSYCFAKHILEELKIEFAVLHNGAQIVMNGKTIYQKKIGKQFSKELCNRLLNTANCVFAFDGEFVYTNNITEESRDYIIAQTRNPDIIKPLSENENALYSISVYGELGSLSNVLSSIPTINFQENQSEITAKGVSKGIGLSRLARILKVQKSNTIAVGDGRNDIDMIKAAGVGIAVGGACEELKAAADMIAAEIEQGGIFKIFKELGLI